MIIDDQKKRFADRESGGQARQWERLQDNFIRLAVQAQERTPPVGRAAR
jgi:hypothetical protein